MTYILTGRCCFLARCVVVSISMNLRSASAAVALFIAIAFGVEAPAQLAVSTVAGSTTGGGYVDDQGVSARFSYPVGVAVDSAGTVYVGDQTNHVIRRISRDNRATTLAGLGMKAGAADGHGTSARFNNPFGVAVDGGGNVYVADSWNHAIRKITPSGVVSTLAGSLGVAGTADGTGGAARFTYPAGVAVDSSGNVYVADTNNHTIRKITPAGVVTTVAGSARFAGTSDGTGSQARFQYPFGVDVDADGTLYVADTWNHTIRKITPGGVVTTIAGSGGNEGQSDGTGSTARFELPWAVDLDGSGDLLVADTGNQLIRRIALSTGVVTSIAGHADTTGRSDGIGTASYFFSPAGIAFDPLSGGMFVADRGNMAIRYIGSTLQTFLFAGSIPTAGTTNAIGTAARFLYPEGIAADAAGNIYVSDNTDTIRRIAPNGQVTLFAGAVDQLGSTDGPGATARFEVPRGLATDSLGNVYVADYGNYTIRKITPGAIVSTFAGSAGRDGDSDGTGPSARFDLPTGVAVDSLNNVYVADSYNNKIKIIDQSGTVRTLAGGSFGSDDGVGASAGFRVPLAVAVDAARNVYVADWGNSLIRKVAPDGRVTTVAGLRNQTGYRDGSKATALFDSPIAIAARPDGTLYVLEEGSHAIRRIDPNGNVTTVAGDYFAPGNVDGVADAARFYFPQGLSIDAQGRLLITDGNNHNVRVAVATAPVITSFTATPQVLETPRPVTLAWTSTGTSATLNGTPVQPNGTMVVTPTQTTTYTLVVTGEAGTVSQQVTVGFGNARRRSVRK